MTTPSDDPIAAHDLAEALREAHAIVVLASVPDVIAVIDEQFYEIDVKGSRERWQALLDRYDAQRLSLALLQALSGRDAAMRFAARYRDESDAKYVKAKVTLARACNWQALRLRRELRALGGEK